MTENNHPVTWSEIGAHKRAEAAPTFVRQNALTAHRPTKSPTTPTALAAFAKQQGALAHD